MTARTAVPRLSIPCLLTLLLAAAQLGCGGGETTAAGDGATAAAEPELSETAGDAGPLCPGCNLILVSLDTLRADRMSLYGYSRPTTPHLDDFARGAVTFERFYHSGGGTLPSHMTMLTGLHPLTHQVDPETLRPLDETRVTLAERLREAGYRTTAFVDGGWMRRRFGFAQGFETYDDSGGHFQDILPKAGQFIETRGEEPFFLFLHTYDIHSEWEKLPYDCPGGHAQTYVEDAPAFDGCRDGRCASSLLAWANTQIEAGLIRGEDVLSADEVAYVSSLYDGCITYADLRLADLFGLLNAQGLLEDSIVVVTSDHGEEFLDHGMFLHEQSGYEEMSRIPLVIHLPESRFASRRVPHLAAMVDLTPTLLSLLGLPPIEDAQGFDLTPAIVENRPVRDHVTMYSDLLRWPWKMLPDEEELFNLDEDPGEQRNLWDVQPDTVGHLTHEVELNLHRDLAGYHTFRLAQEEAYRDRMERLAAKQRRQGRAVREGVGTGATAGSREPSAPGPAPGP
jgi:arylsulfatase A-like enzyme